MTQNEHTFIAVIICFILHQILLHSVLKHDPVVKKDAKELCDMLDEYFFK